MYSKQNVLKKEDCIATFLSPMMGKPGITVPIKLMDMIHGVLIM